MFHVLKFIYIILSIELKNMCVLVDFKDFVSVNPNKVFDALCELDGPYKRYVMYSKPQHQPRLLISL